MITKKNTSKTEEDFWQKKYLRKGFFWGKYFRFLPFVRGVAVCNSLSMGEGGKHSDIDLFIIVASGHIWTARFFVTLFCQLLGIRRHGKKVAGRLCLSFFVTEKALDFQKIAFSPKDPYLAKWLRHLRPVFGRMVFANILEKNRVFIQKNGGGEMFWKNERDAIPPSSIFFGERFLGKRVENFFRRKMRPRTMKKYEALVDKSGTIISDDMLKFHNTDRRSEFLSSI